MSDVENITRADPPHHTLRAPRVVNDRDLVIEALRLEVAQLREQVRDLTERLASFGVWIDTGDWE